MKNVEFENEEIKIVYDNIIKGHKGLSGIINLLLNEGGSFVVSNIKKTEFGIEMDIIQDNENIKIFTDFLKKKIYLKKPDKLYSEIYDDYQRQVYTPSGYLYQNNDRNIIKTFFFNEKLDDENTFNYILNDNGKQYSIIIDDNNGLLVEADFINKLLYYKAKYNSIRDLFMAINEEGNIKNCDIKLADSKGSNIVINDGKVLRYIEYYENNGNYEKIYLEDNKFFIEKMVKEVYHDNLTSYIEKMGEDNGKEKRKVKFRREY